MFEHGSFLDGRYKRGGNYSFVYVTTRENENTRREGGDMKCYVPLKKRREREKKRSELRGGVKSWSAALFSKKKPNGLLATFNCDCVANKEKQTDLMLGTCRSPFSFPSVRKPLGVCTNFSEEGAEQDFNNGPRLQLMPSILHKLTNVPTSAKTYIYLHIYTWHLFIYIC